MALSLRAEQKSINSIYAGGDEVYVIPNYQRPYSWGKDVCYQLFSDITDAFLNKDDYFIGNIVMAKGMDDKKRPNVVDGQQRLITLWLFMKVLTLMHPDKSRLQRTLVVQSLLSDEDEPRINSLVYEHKDQDNIVTVLGYTLDDFNLQYDALADSKGNIRVGVCSRIEANALYIYKWISEFYEQLSDNSKQEAFLKFFLEHVFLLPIELESETLTDAASRALTIFETINNRGQSLEDSDIFKARLYEQAQKAHKEKDFISQWLEFTNACQDMKMTVDDLFRYYYHILRGKDGQTSNESGLREYFTGTANSALSIRTYDDIIEDLNNIIYFISWMQSQKNEESPYGRWLQVLDLYTNQYPKYALVNYLYYYGVDNNSDNLLSFIKMLVRYYYYRGATLQVKYETYRINKMIAIEEKVPTYDCSDFDPATLEHIGLLRNGFALLAHYLQNPDSFIENVFFDRAIYEREFYLLPANWHSVDYENVRNNIANIMALDLPKRNFRSLLQKGVYYSTSQIPAVRQVFDTTGTVYLMTFKKRESELKKILYSFFRQK
jgi:uncharacterized protein with ParB-like and HNH nuclease domain